MPQKKDLVGQRFGRLVVRKQGPHEGRSVAWECVCDCGGVSVVTTGRLRSGNTKSCGCGKYVGFEPYHKITHGQASAQNGKPTRIYQIYKSMVRRCTRSADPAYYKYGGRGITVCARWRHSFENFYADMGERPEGKSLDRIDNDGPYSPENCRWATPLEQGANTRQNRWITAGGMTKHLTGWARHFGVCPSTMWKQLKRQGVNFLEQKLKQE